MLKYSEQQPLYRCVRLDGLDAGRKWLAKRCGSLCVHIINALRSAIDQSDEAAGIVIAGLLSEHGAEMIQVGSDGNPCLRPTFNERLTVLIKFARSKGYEKLTQSFRARLEASGILTPALDAALKAHVTINEIRMILHSKAEADDSDAESKSESESESESEEEDSQ